MHLWELDKAGISIQVLQVKPGGGLEVAMEVGEAGGAGGREEHMCHMPISPMFILLS